jgi:ABC-type multidrug transport system fused ATPase/permease subunit
LFVYFKMLSVRVCVCVYANKQLLFNATIMFVTSWRLTLVVFGVVPVVIISIALYGKAVRKVAVKYSDALGDATDTAQESIRCVLYIYMHTYMRVCQFCYSPTPSF